MTSLIWIAIALAGIAALVIGLAAYGAARWADSTHALQFALDGTRVPLTTRRYDARELEGLPAPVQRYFRAVLTNGQRMVTAVTVEHVGTMNLSQTKERWKPFRSQQRVITRRPGFVWSARIALMPAIAVYVHDAYIAGAGILNASVMGLYSLADLRDEGEMARGELIRYFAETAWYPTALLPSQGVRWDPVDEHSANATLTDGERSVTMHVRFDDAGLIESAGFEGRGATVGTTIVQIPWEGRWANYQERDGMRVPLTGEAVWLPAGERKPYWRGTVASIEYEFSP